MVGLIMRHVLSSDLLHLPIFFSLRSSDGKTAVDVAKHLEMRELIRKFEEHSKKKFAERMSVLPAITKDFVFELCDLNFPMIFEVWLARENR